MKKYETEIREYLNKEADILQQLNIEEIGKVISVLEEARLKGSAIYVCGNGGSAATASHYVCDFNKGVSLNQDKKFRFTCLSDNIPSMTAIANDIGYERIFDIPLRGKIKKSDLLIAISGSGNSENVINAVRFAKETGALVIGVTGYDGGEVIGLSDYQLHVPIKDMQIVEDVHMIFDHMMMQILHSV